MMLKGMTAEYLLRRTYKVRKGDTVLVHAAAGGVGLILCQWANALGATVIGTVGSHEKAKLAKKNGAHHTILYRDEDFVKRVARSPRAGNARSSMTASARRPSRARSIVSPRLAPSSSFGSASGPIEAFNLGILSQKGSLYATRPTLGTFMAQPGGTAAMATAALQGGRERLGEDQGLEALPAEGGGRRASCARRPRDHGIADPRPLRAQERDSRVERPCRRARLNSAPIRKPLHDAGEEIIGVGARDRGRDDIADLERLARRENDVPVDLGRVMHAAADRALRRRPHRRSRSRGVPIFARCFARLIACWWRMKRSWRAFATFARHFRQAEVIRRRALSRARRRSSRPGRAAPRSSQPRSSSKSSSVSPGKPTMKVERMAMSGTDFAPARNPRQRLFLRRRAAHRLSTFGRGVLEGDVEIGQDQPFRHQGHERVDMRVGVDVVQTHPRAERAEPAREIEDARLDRLALPARWPRGARRAP